MHNNTMNDNNTELLQALSNININSETAVEVVASTNYTNQPLNAPQCWCPSDSLPHSVGLS